MAIRELSQERRNIMLPRYWRYLEKQHVAGPVNVPGWPTYVLVVGSSAFTPTEPSHIWILYTSYAVGIAPAGKRYWQYDLQVSIGGGAYANLNNHSQSVEIAANANLEQNAMNFIHENVAAGVSLQYQIWAVSAAGMTQSDWYNNELELQICRA